MEAINRIKIGTGTTHNIYDARVSTGTTFPSSTTDGDIVLKTNEVQTKNHWHYVMHGSTCECWTVIPNASGVCTTALQGGYISGNLTIPSGYTLNYPVTFSAQPTCIMNISKTCDYSMYMILSQDTANMGTTTMAPQPRICRETAGPSSALTCNVYIYAIGTVA